MIEAGKEYLFIDGDSDISAERIMPGPHSDIGAELRASREARDLDIPTVAQDLRIREAYLRSLESGAYEDLPGVPYAIGFVRSYAKYLRLDPADMVRRFKAEVNAHPERDHLAFPQPVRYGRMPGIALIAISIAIAGMLYGGWYFYSAEQNESLAAKARATGDAVAKTTAPMGTAADTAAAPARGASVAKAGNPKAGNPKAGNPKADAAKTPNGALPHGAVPGGAAKKAATHRADDHTPGTRKSADAAVKDTTVGRSGTTSGAPKTSAAVAAEKKATGQIAALPKDRTIRLKATANAWVQIRNRENRVVFVKVLRAGDSYEVPKRDGLVMNVGNAGGLRITVGEAAIKPLGPANMPVFNVSLDPRTLLEHRR